MCQRFWLTSLVSDLEVSGIRSLGAHAKTYAEADSDTDGEAKSEMSSEMDVDESSSADADISADTKPTP